MSDASAGPPAFEGINGWLKNQFDFGGGWVFGLEVFFNPYASVNFEVGTSSGTAGNTGKELTVGTGLLFYPFNGLKR